MELDVVFLRLRPWRSCSVIDLTLVETRVHLVTRFVHVCVQVAE